MVDGASASTTSGSAPGSSRASKCSARGATDEQLGDDPVIQRGDVLHCDFGITVARLNTDTQHIGYVLRPGETDAPAGLRRRSPTPTRCRTSSSTEIRPGRTGNEILPAVTRADEGAQASTARSTRIRSGCTATAPVR